MEPDALTAVLLACLHPEASDALSPRLAQLTPVDWEALLRLARYHGIAPLLRRRLQPLASAAKIPSGILQTLRNDYLAIAGRNSRLYDQLGVALQLFGHEGLPVIVLIGAHLAELVYGNIALRSMGDVDLLIRRTDLPRVEAVLLENGYRPDPHNGPAMQTEHFHYVYSHAPSGLVLEMHWHILPPQDAALIDVEQLWKQATPAKIANVETLVLSPEALLLHLCLHLYHHRFDTGLRAYCDIAEVIGRYRDVLAWQELAESLQTNMARRVVYIALRLTQSLLGTPAPDDILSALYAGDTSEWEAVLRERILHGEAEALSLKSLGLGGLWGKQPLRDKAMGLLRGLFPSAETMAQLYPVPARSFHRYLYYPRYLIRMFGKFGSTAWCLMRGDPGLRQKAASLEALDQWLRSP